MIRFRPGREKKGASKLEYDTDGHILIPCLLRFHLRACIAAFGRNGICRSSPTLPWSCVTSSVGNRYISRVLMRAGLHNRFVPVCPFINSSLSWGGLSARPTHHLQVTRRSAAADDDAPPELNSDWRAFRAKLIKQSQSGGALTACSAECMEVQHEANAQDGKGDLSLIRFTKFVIIYYHSLGLRLGLGLVGALGRQRRRRKRMPRQRGLRRELQTTTGRLR